LTNSEGSVNLVQLLSYLPPFIFFHIFVGVLFLNCKWKAFGCRTF